MKIIEVEGFDELAQTLDKLPAQSLPILENAMEESLLYLEGIVTEYPPQPSRTRAKTFNTYVRGHGRYPRSAFTSAGMLSKRAAKRPGPRGGQIKYISERLGTKWTHQVTRTEDAIEGVIGNTTSYAPYVEGEQQTDYHAETGWPRLDQVIEREEAVIYGNFERASEMILDLVAS